MPLCFTGGRSDRVTARQLLAQPGLTRTEPVRKLLQSDRAHLVAVLHADSASRCGPAGPAPPMPRGAAHGEPRWPGGHSRPRSAASMEGTGPGGDPQLPAQGRTGSTRNGTGVPPPAPGAAASGLHVDIQDIGHTGTRSPARNTIQREKKTHYQRKKISLRNKLEIGHLIQYEQSLHLIKDDSRAVTKRNLSFI